MPTLQPTESGGRASEKEAQAIFLKSLMYTAAEAEFGIGKKEGTKDMKFAFWRRRRR
jgi:hypothetical protein